MYMSITHYNFVWVTLYLFQTKIEKSSTITDLLQIPTYCVTESHQAQKNSLDSITYK